MANPRNSRIDAAAAGLDSIALCRSTIFWWLPVLYLLISSAFYLRTYDSAQVKITLVQMGGLCLAALWVCRLLEEGRAMFSKDDLLCLAPFLAYLGYGIFSFLHAPYHWSSTDFFLRRVFYMTVALIVIQEFNEAAISRLVRIMIWSTWIAVLYGVLQWFDTRVFPRGPGLGIDPFIWRGAFGDRVFSTYGNPNFFADYLVLMFPVVYGQYLKKRKWRYLVLMVLDVFDLWSTMTKGAWIGFAITAILLVSTHFYFFDREKLRRYRLWIAGGSFGLMALVLTAVWIKLMSSFTSVNFRLFTWEATWEMIMTRPVIGTGIGSFWVIYPAFRRPPIFHIEGKHNTETDHSEDEYLEVLFDEGIVGFGIFIWLILSTCVVAYRSLQQLTGSLRKGERAPPRVYELMGFLVAFQGMLIHNCFDVSMRFVSSGVYVGLLSGMVVNLSRGRALSEFHSRRDVSTAGSPGLPEGASRWDFVSRFFIWPARLAAWGGLCYISYQLLSQFSELQGPLSRAMGGEFLQWWIAWTCFLGCVAGLGFAFLRIVYLTRNPLVPAVVCLMLLPLNIVWGFFKADVYQNIAIFFSKQQNWDEALKYYQKVGDLNPAYVMSFYFKGNVFNDRFNMDKVYNEKWGDKKDSQGRPIPRDDFERALTAYEEVRARAPNYVQMHHQVGTLYMKYGDWLHAHGRAEEGDRALDEALHRFQMYRNIDPVFPPNYFRMGQIYFMRKQYDKAAQIFDALIEARECRVRPDLLGRDSLRKTILRYQDYVQRDGEWVHLHESPDAYANLGNAYFMMNDPARAEGAYKNALRLDPNNANASRNLALLDQRLKSSGRRVAPPVVPAPVSGGVPSFEAPVIKK